MTRGVDFVLQEPFDPVRRYIRAPRAGERWPYGEDRVPGKLVTRIAVEVVNGADGEAFRMQLFNGVFFVDLNRASGFSEWLRSTISDIKIV